MGFSLYFVSDRPDRVTRRHQLHKNDCTQLPAPEQMTCVGYYGNHDEALMHAKEIYANVEGCSHCFSQLVEPVS
ncbi:hypothetical protein VV869_16465 [Photobacterium sp. MCCC 1A19761]|uniref:hypothetical protein n=1 Tax=Photobacterium sp. MCCC 1A19761 TaxID=3115000 RepID=UPI00307F6C10